MASSAASAASSDSNRAAYARILESGIDSHRPRLDGSAISAFDLLLEFPVFDSQILPAESRADAEQLDERNDEEPNIADDESRASETDANPIPILVPIANRIEESFKQDSNLVPIAERTLNREQARESSELSEPVILGTPVAEVPSTAGTIATTTVVPREADHHTQPDLFNEPVVKLTKSTEQEPRIAVPSLVQVGGHPSDEPVNEPSLEVPFNVERPSVDRRLKETALQPSIIQRRAVPSSEPLPIPKSPKAKHSPKHDKGQPDTDSVRPANNTSSPSFNRRSERLAEAKRGQHSKDSSDKPESEPSNTIESAGHFEIPAELTVDSESIDPTLEITVSGAELKDSNPTLHDTSAATAGVSGPILSTAIAATTSSVTSSLVRDGNKDAVINGIGGTHGAVTTSESSAGRNASSLAGRSSALSTYQEHRVLQRVLKGLDQLDNGGSQVRLRLHPPELGSLQITLRVDSQQVSAFIEVEHVAARDVLLSNLPQLQSRLSDQGLNVSQFDVQIVDPNQWSQGSGESGGFQSGRDNADSNRSSRYVDRLRNQLDRGPTAEATRPVTSLWTRKNGELDVRY